MNQLVFGRYSGPLIALGGLVGTRNINRTQPALAHTVREDVAGMQATMELQVQLRHLRVHSLVLVADQTQARRDTVQGDFLRLNETPATRRTVVTDPDDATL